MYISPHFDYCDTIYDRCITIQDRTGLETLQSRAARLTTGTLFRTSSDKLRLELGWDKLTHRRVMHKITLYHKLNQSNHLVPNYIKQMIPNTREQDTNRTLRNATTHSHERPHTTSYQRSFFIATNKQYDKLPNAVRSLPMSKFKAYVSKHRGSPQPPDFYAFGSKTGNIAYARLRNDMRLKNR